MTRNGVLQKVFSGVLSLVVCFGFLYLSAQGEFGVRMGVIGWGVPGVLFLLLTVMFIGGALGDWQTKWAFERIFGVELPSWIRDVSGVQAAKREAAQKSATNVLREANNDFFFHAIQESGAVQRILSLYKDNGEKKTTDEKKKEINAHRSLVAVIQEKRRAFFKFQGLAKKCGIRIPKELERLAKIEVTIELPVEAKR